MTAEPYIPIPEEVREIYALCSPTPLSHARRLEKTLHTPPVSTISTRESLTGSHKPNTVVPQAFYNKREGVRRLTAETGAG